MARYNLIFDEEARTLSIEEPDAKIAKSSRTVSTLPFPEAGTTPEPTAPAPRQHLQNVALMLNIPFEEMKIVNNTSNKQLDELEKAADKSASSARNSEKKILSGSASRYRTPTSSSDDGAAETDQTNEELTNNPMDHDGDGQPGGSLKGDKSTAHRGHQRKTAAQQATDEHLRQTDGTDGEEDTNTNQPDEQTSEKISEQTA